MGGTSELGTPSSPRELLAYPSATPGMRILAQKDLSLEDRAVLIHSPSLQCRFFSGKLMKRGHKGMRRWDWSVKFLPEDTYPRLCAKNTEERVALGTPYLQSSANLLFFFSGSYSPLISFSLTPPARCAYSRSRMFSSRLICPTDQS